MKKTMLTTTRDLRFDADAEPQDEERRQRQLRQAVAADHEGIDDLNDGRKAAQHERQDDRRHRADDAAKGGFLDRVAGMADELAIPIAK